MTQTIAQLLASQNRLSLNKPLSLQAIIAVYLQRAKKVVSDRPGLMDFAIWLVIFVLNLPDRQVQFFGEIQITEGL